MAPDASGARDAVPVLELQGVDAGHGAVQVLRGVTLHVMPGESVAIVGANGAGKSTLVQTICGLLPVRAGSIRKSGQEIGKVPAHRRSLHGLAVVLEGRRLFGELSVATNLALAEATGAARVRKFTREDVLALFPYMRSRLDAPVSVLSGGEQQMVAIARALLLQPDLLVLDEPSTGLAPKVVKEIVAVVSGLRTQGMSLMLVEQNAAVAAEMTDRAYVMSLGRVAHEMTGVEWKSGAGSQALVGAYLGH